LFLNPSLELLRKGRKAQKEMLRIPNLGGTLADAATDINQIYWIQRFATLVTLVPSSLGTVAIRTRALHVAIREEPPAIGTVGQKHLVPVYVALVKQRKE
jgi:hypothetical protein